MSTKSQIALLYEIELKTILESATLSNSEKVKQLVYFKPDPVWNQENKKYEYVRECGPIREKVRRKLKKRIILILFIFVFI